jgi:energy-coupling factor transporter ATP-binding protein EcfA2
MQFKVIPYKGYLPTGATNVVILLTDGWDDWFKFSTMYNVIWCDASAQQHRIGEVKIGQFGMLENQRSADLPVEFETLDDRFFSLGQDDSYYQNLNDLGDDFRDAFLSALRDVARDGELFERALTEDVTGVSLLRSVSDKSVRGQYRRMAQGQARLTAYSFSFTPPPWGKVVQPDFDFKVVPESSPPTNVHVLIGRNGVGKTHIVNHMAQALVKPDVEDDYGEFKWHKLGPFDDGSDDFPSIISVTFSAFDPFEPISDRKNKSTEIRYQYIGLKHISKDSAGNPRPPKSPDDLAADFGKSVQLIVTQAAKRQRWRHAISLLESDRNFQRAEVWRLIDEYEDSDVFLSTKDSMNQLRESARKLFKNLSSGHKIVLLTITRLIETLEERSLVLLDEPEAHLHPPLLSAFVRALSDLLINRNGVAIIATHSPVILQEVPRTCVWRIRRSGRERAIERPESETFGENVGALTHAIFGLEVTDSGFHKLLSDAVNEGLDFEGVLNRFGNQLGDEARAITRSLIATRDGQV